MEKELCAAILFYTGNSVYASLNKVLWVEDHRGAKKYLSYLRLFLEAMDCMPSRRTNLWRGISCDLFS
jgi:hypothetical protein